VRILIANSILGTEQHFVSDSNTGTCLWSSHIPKDVWVVGHPGHVMSIEALGNVLGEKPIQMFPDAHKKAFETLCPEGLSSKIPWRWVLGDQEHRTRLKAVLESARFNVCALEESNYKQTYIKIRKFLLELNQPIIDLSKMNKYIQTNEKGQTVEASLRSFTPINGRAPKIIYDHAATATGRLTVKQGPRILTLPARHRDIIAPESKCQIVQIDLVSAEPRTALYAAGKEPMGDIYKDIANSLSLDIPRASVKLAILSALYGASSSRLASILGSKARSKRIIDRLRAHFGVGRIESQLHLEMKEKGYITNLFGRKLKTRRDEIQKAYSHFMQSTTSDAAICMFSDMCEVLSQHDKQFKPLYVIHDALVCQVSSRLRHDLEKLSKRILLGGVGFYETKMTSVNDN